MLNQQEIVKATKEVEQLCTIHKKPMIQLDRVVSVKGEDKPRKLPPFCPECIREKNEKQDLEESNKALNADLYRRTYDVLKRDSTIPKELQGATFENFKVGTTEERQLLDFAKNQVKKYLNGMVGNTLFTGSTGIGKTHMAVSMAKALNEGYKDKGEPRSVLFVNLTEILRKIRDSFNRKESLEGYYSQLLKEADYLILDDLGVKLGNANGKSKSTWEEEFIFDILSHRENTIITTNLSNAEITNLYSERVSSRVRSRLEGNFFKSFTIKDKRFSLNNLKESVDQLIMEEQNETENIIRQSKRI